MITNLPAPDGLQVVSDVVSHSRSKGRFDFSDRENVDPPGPSSFG
jgi:hypothetical protein